MREMASSSSMASPQTLILRNPRFLSRRHVTSLSFPSSGHIIRALRSRSSSSKPPPPLAFSLPRRSPPTTVVASSTVVSPNSAESKLVGSTRSITTVVSFAFSIWTIIASKSRDLGLKLREIGANPSSEEMAAIEALRESRACTLFFAAAQLNTPLTVVASGMGKWLDIYSGVLMVRVLLSWFPNIPWDRQPLSAIRDLCDPYLNLFRNIIPPIFDALDVSPLLAFAVLGTLGSILNSSRGGY